MATSGYFFMATDSPGKGEVDVGVRVCLKMCRQLGLEVGDLMVQLGDGGDRGASGGTERGGDSGRRTELFTAQRRLNLQCSGVEVTLSPCSFQRRSDTPTPKLRCSRAFVRVVSKMSGWSKTAGSRLAPPNIE